MTERIATYRHDGNAIRCVVGASQDARVQLEVVCRVDNCKQTRPSEFSIVLVHRH